MDRPIGIVWMAKGTVAYQVHILTDISRKMEFGMVKYKGIIKLNEEN